MNAFKVGGRLRNYLTIPNAGYLWLLLTALFFLTTIALPSIVSAAPSMSDTPTWVNETTIRVGDSNFEREGSKTDNPWVFSFTDSKTVSLDVGSFDLDCRSTLTFTSDPYTGSGSTSARLNISTVDGDTCASPNPNNQLVTVENAEAAQLAPGEEDPDAGLSAEAKFCRGWSDPLSWILCPINEGLFRFADSLNLAINQLMTVDTNAIFNSEEATSNAYKDAFNSFRMLALGFVVIAALVIIIASAVGLEIFDAYTIKKALPRVVLAVIFISLSWPILEFLITLSNDVGNGIRALIYAPFADFERIRLTWGEQTIFTLLLTSAGFFLTTIGLLSFVGTAALAVLVAFLVLIIREMIIVLLVIAAPIGIACLILPNTQKGWQLWQNTLTVMLIAFPIIAAIIATGRVFSAVAYSSVDPGASSGGDIGTLVPLSIAFIAYFLPYFLLPLTFSLAGGLLGRLGAFANDSERGAFDRLKKFRQNKSAETMQKIKSGNRFESGNIAARGINRAGMRAGVGFKNRFGYGRKGAEAMDQRQRVVAGELAKTPGGQAIQDDDEALMAMVYLANNSAGKATDLLAAKYQSQNPELSKDAASAKATRAVKSAQASRMAGSRAGAIFAAQQMVATGTGYKDLDEMTETIALASGGNASSAAGMAGYANAIAKQKGRHDLAPGAGNVINDVYAKMNDNISDPLYKLKNPETGEVVRTKDYSEQMQEAWNSGSLYQIVNGKGGQTKNFVKHHIQNARSSDPKKRMQAAVAFTELQHSLPSASGANQQIIIKALEDVGIDYKERDLDAQIAEVTKHIIGPLPEGVERDNKEHVKDVIARKARIYDRDGMDPETRARLEGGE